MGEEGDKERGGGKGDKKDRGRREGVMGEWGIRKIERRGRG